jgi:hypothetical protein
MNVVKRSVANHPFVTLTIIIALAAVGLIMIFFPQYQAEKYLKTLTAEDRRKPDVQKNAFDIENANRLTVAQIVGGIALLIGLYFTYQNVKVSQDNAKTAQDNLRLTEDGKLTDRFSKAVELLGNERIDVRLGGIYALESIARDSQKYHWTVMEVLTAYVRKYSPRKSEDATDKEKLREDIQAAMTVIGRRIWAEEETDSQRLDLKGVDLRECVLSDVNLSRADLSKSNLKEAVLVRANLWGAQLESADLTGAKLSRANLELANLESANLENANLNYAKLIQASLEKAILISATLNEANLTFTNFRFANLNLANLTAAQNLTLEQIQSADSLAGTQLPADLADELEKSLKTAQPEKAGES